MADTHERSLAHWSEAKRRGMEAFYTLATDDYRHLAAALDWRAWLEARQAEAGDRALHLLDVACGSGKFPTALTAHADVARAAIRPVDYALLDPSSFSLAEARQALAPPFVAGRAFETTLQGFDTQDRSYDIVWATHALYAIPKAELPAALERFLRAIGGRGFIAHAMEAAHYIRFYRLFLDAFRDGGGESYRTAEEIVDGLGRLGARVELREIAYDSAAPAAARSVVEGFLQRCAFDDGVTLDQMLDHPLTGPYLADCHDEHAWRFPQRVGLIFVSP
ncbi:MAG: class I SAM-dependent methyltransferase [Pseudomonadota bacterium]